MWILMGTIFVASLLGSMHCVGMCGPFAMLAGATDQPQRSAFAPTIAYSGGRLVTYSLVGLLFGSLGLALNQGTSFTSWQQSATYVAGGLMIVVGLISLVRYLGIQVGLPKIFRPLGRFLQAGFATAKSLPPLKRAFAIGALTSLMPCGWLYTFAITAAGTGSPVMGMLVMAVFWAGTVPIMTTLMLGVDRIHTPIQKRLPVLMASLVIAIGIFTIVHRAPVANLQHATVVTGTTNLTEQIRDFDQSTLPCCHCQTESEK